MTPIKNWARFISSGLFALIALLVSPALVMASEADLIIPTLTAGQNNLLYLGLVVCALGMLFGLYQFIKVSKLEAHQSMLDVAATIYETCKTYLLQQGKLLC
ncbi:MAG TPA: hypothetical protein PLM35_00470, partial [Cyclobacteriaceae bacterium]|nr:hypothetical protein [Cyclobacteriaceae bacterium]